MVENGFTTRDYIRWRGDVSFSKDPFNSVDNLILSELCYLDFQEVIDQNKKRTHMRLKDCLQSGKVQAIHDGLMFRESRMECFTLAAQSERFGNIEVCNYVDLFDEEAGMQFAMMEFRLDAFHSYIAYRGTDNSILGWKEDFMISFTKTNAQVMAAKYLEDVIGDFGFRKYFVGGHSKGANLALIACSKLSKKKQDRIVSVFDNDGPGICKDVIDLSIVDPIFDRVVAIQPEYCVVGRLFDMHFPNTTIVKSWRSGTNQHDIGSWLVEDPHHLLVSLEHDPGSTWMAKVFNEWCFQLKEEDRRAFVEEFFDSLLATGAKDFDQLEENRYEGVLKALLKTSPNVKDAGWLLPKTAMQIGVKMMQDSFHEGIGSKRKKRKGEL